MECLKETGTDPFFIITFSGTAMIGEKLWSNEKLTGRNAMYFGWQAVEKLFHL